MIKIDHPLDSKSCYLQRVKVDSDSDAKFLFDLLEERDVSANISHKKMPSYNSHVQFIKSEPYKKWYIIYVRHYLSSLKDPLEYRYDKEKVGSIYLSKNDEIGIFISKKFHGKNIGKYALNDLMAKDTRIKRYLANVNPKNKKSIAFFKKNGFELLQHTFELKKV
tara:strand:+ start:508 stop:1002 length:495 start_codon:yes stop_codon:yes gene_type:complete